VSLRARYQLARVVVCTVGAVCVDDEVLFAATAELAAAVGSVAVPLVPTVATGDEVVCETVAALFCANIRVPPMVKNEATLIPARRIRLAAAG
jgi:hypothetical protein